MSTPTDELEDPSLHTFAEGFASLARALYSPSYTIENRDQFVAGVRLIQEVNADRMPEGVWCLVIRFMLGRDPTPDESAALDYPESTAELEEAFGRLTREKLMVAEFGPDWRDVIARVTASGANQQ